MCVCVSVCVCVCVCVCLERGGSIQSHTRQLEMCVRTVTFNFRWN